MAMSQRDGVYMAICAVLGADHGVVTNESLTRGQKEQIHSIVIDGLAKGKIELKGERTIEWITKYVPGLVNNWVRKDTRLNGGSKYETKNPGIRQGSGDPQIKAMKALLSATTDPDQRATIQAAIDARQEEIKPKAKEIDINALPEHLRALAASLLQ